ncbi:GroES-like protein [Dothidotthia symphoricarpi CBS 119687]|uniref:GroES-like protein n=1 Tax=Dothidotthia symphoricarpi CBS 119687 TaxID=1392245 RepID=A0A6A5ZZX0_9PLEO|nr:GroES-like protein [Dothidotthia symphoricarpi CBS 119687]KAF2123881.1 GroES-like protein [Dothidotthia symphoricarpi CBS 119687]
MPTQKAIICKSKGISELSNDASLPTLPADNWILVKTKAVALNPSDWKHVANWPSPGMTGGLDYAGVVEEVGKDVTELKAGDRVAGFVRGNDPEDHQNGAFAEHIKAKVGIHMKIPDDMSFEDAATLPVAITTVGQALFQSLGLPLPPAKVKEPTPILIYGASTATGTVAVQYAKLAGCEVLTTSSPHNFDLLRKLGADQVFDYKDAEVGAKIRAATDDKLHLVLDCISQSSSFAICAAAVSSRGGHVSALLGAKGFPRDDVRANATLGYTALGEKYSNMFPANQADYEFGCRFWKLAESLVSSGKIKPHPKEVRRGLDGIPQGLKDLEDGKVSGVKLVYTVD